KSGGGQRMYSQREIDIILRIKQLLYSEGFTIAGAKKKLDGELNGKLELVSADSGGAGEAVPSVDRAVIRRLRKELGEILAILDR
ncbi:MAG TPA: MerR family transcriptional regulator, partial [Thermoanaerobaculia bacterium]|nr:MerR family transcriptional regulator [Thermoanaerobaculia bacterium]